MTHPARLVAIDLWFLDQPSVKRPRDHDVLAHPGIDKGVTANEVVEPSAFQLKGGRPDHFTGARVAVEGARVVFTVEDLEPVPEGITAGSSVACDVQSRLVSAGTEQEAAFSGNSGTEGGAIHDPGSGSGTGVIRNHPHILPFLHLEGERPWYAEGGLLVQLGEVGRRFPCEVLEHLCAHPFPQGLQLSGLGPVDLHRFVAHLPVA